MRKLLFAPAVLALAATCAWGQGQGSGILYASDFNAWSLPQSTSPTAGMILWPSAICNVSSTAYTFMAVKVGRPITIVDAVSSQTETVIPTSVTNNGGTCSVTAPMTYTHMSYSVRSGTAGLQEAIDFSSRVSGGAVVVLTPAWTIAGGSSGMITAATGQTSVSILDQRTATLCSYSWGGSAYANVGCNTAGSALTGVTASTGITGGGTSGNVSVAIDATVVPLLGSANTFTDAITDAAGFLGPLTGDVTGNVSGTALTITGNVTESQVTNLTSDLAGKVATTQTVNGHALSAPVVVSASDLTTGTLLHARLPTLLSGDIPNNAANTSGTSAGLTGAPAVTVSSVTISGCSGKYTLADGTGCGTPAGSLPSASDTFNTTQTNAAGAGSPLLSTTSGTWEAAQNGNADNTGSTDASTILNTKTAANCSSSTPTRIHLAAGTYTVNSSWTISATSTTCKNMVIEGDGSGNTIIQGNCSSHPYVVAWINGTSPAAEHFNGPTFRHLTIKNTGSTACAIGLEISQAALFKVEDVVITGFAGQTYATGTISSTGSTVNCSGCTFTAAMAKHGFIETTSSNTTTRAEVCAFVSSTQVTLCDSAFPTGDLAGSTAYALAYGGAGLVCDPGAGISSGPFTQFSMIKDVFASGNLIGIQAWGTTSGGCSRVKVTGGSGYITPNAGSRIADSVGIWLGHNSDTWDIDVPINNQAACIVNDSGHAHWINAKCENGGTFDIVTTCNSGVASQACTAAFEWSADANGSGWNTEFDGAYAYKVGNVYQFDNSTGAFNASIMAPRDLSGQYTVHYTFYGTTGCPAGSSGIPVIVSAYDCNHQLVAATIN